MVGYQLDDSQSLHRKWLEITKHPIKNGCLEYQVDILEFDTKGFCTTPWDSFVGICNLFSPI